jgi:hypothetical protein
MKVFLGSKGVGRDITPLLLSTKITKRQKAYLSAPSKATG